VEGHLNYYAITDNVRACVPVCLCACGRFVYFATRILLKWLNRKSQRKAHNWDQYNQALAAVGWPRARILKDLNPCRRAEACGMAGRGAGCGKAACPILGGAGLQLGPWARYCGTVGKPGGNRVHKLRPTVRGVPGLLKTKSQLDAIRHWFMRYTLFAKSPPQDSMLFPAQGLLHLPGACPNRGGESPQKHCSPHCVPAYSKLRAAHSLTQKAVVICLLLTIKPGKSRPAVPVLFAPRLSL